MYTRGKEPGYASHADIPVGSFNETGWHCVRYEGVHELVVYEHYVIDSSPKRASSKPENGKSHSHQTPVWVM